jgi:hypothetical protein
MKINGYEIKIVCANSEDGMYGDIYDDIDEYQKDHPGEEVLFGYYCHPKDYKAGKPALDWFYTLEDAIEFTSNPKKIMEKYGYKMPILDKGV